MYSDVSFESFISLKLTSGLSYNGLTKTIVQITNWILFNNKTKAGCEMVLFGT